MSIALLHSRTTLGIRAVPVRVEIHLGPGLPGFTVVGLADTAVRESKDRVRSALINGGFRIPQQRITVNLAPADLPKDGGRFDLPIAVGILLASGQLGRVDLKDMEWIGELALSGALSPVPAVLPGALAAARPAQFAGEADDHLLGGAPVLLRQHQRAGSGEQGREIGIPVEEMAQIGVGDGRDMALRFPVPVEAMHDAGGDQQQAWRFEADLRRLRAHRAAAVGDQEDMVEIAVNMRADRPFAGAGAIIETFDVDEAFADAPLWFAIEIEAGDGG